MSNPADSAARIAQLHEGQMVAIINDAPLGGQARIYRVGEMAVHSAFLEGINCGDAGWVAGDRILPMERAREGKGYAPEGYLFEGKATDGTRYYRHPDGRTVWRLNADGILRFESYSDAWNRIGATLKLGDGAAEVVKRAEEVMAKHRAAADEAAGKSLLSNPLWENGTPMTAREASKLINAGLYTLPKTEKWADSRPAPQSPRKSPRKAIPDHPGGVTDITVSPMWQQLLDEGVLLPPDWRGGDQARRARAINSRTAGTRREDGVAGDCCGDDCGDDCGGLSEEDAGDDDGREPFDDMPPFDPDEVVPF